MACNAYLCLDGREDGRLVLTSNDKRRPGQGGGANLTRRSNRVVPLYFDFSGEAIAPLALIIETEASRRLSTLSRAVRVVR